MPVSDADLERVATGSAAASPPPTGPSDADLEAIASGQPVAQPSPGPSEHELAAVASSPPTSEPHIWDRLNDFGRFIKAAPDAAGKIAESYVKGAFPPLPIPEGWTADAVSTLVGIPVGLLDFLTSSKMQPTNLGNLIEAGGQAAEMTGLPETGRMALHPGETLERLKKKPFSTALPVVQAGLTVAGAMKVLGQPRAAPPTTAEVPADVAPVELPAPPPLEVPRIERRGQVQAPPGTRDLEFTDTGELKPGPLKTGEILWQDKGVIQRGKYAGQAPGPAGSTLLKVTDEAGKERFFQVREGESRVMVQPQLIPPARLAPVPFASLDRYLYEHPEATMEQAMAAIRAESEPASFQAMHKQVYKQLEEQGLGGRKSMAMLTRKQMADEIVPELERRGFVPGEKQPVPGFVTETAPEAATGEAGAFEQMVAEDHPKAAPEVVTRAAALRSEPLPQEADLQGPAPPAPPGGPPTVSGTPLRPSGKPYPTALGDFLGRLSDKFGLRPKYFREFERYPDLAEAVSRQMNANAWLDQQRNVYKAEVRKIGTEAERNEAARFLVSEQGKVVGGRVPVMSATEEAGLSKGARAVLAWWKQEFQPAFERLSPGAGVKTFRQTGSGHFTSLKAVLPEDLPTTGGRQVVGYEKSGTTGNVVAKYRKLTSQAAKQAKGTGVYYSADLEDLIDHNLGLRTTQFARNDLVNTVKNYQVPAGPDGNVPRETRFMGRLEPVVNLEIEPALTNLVTPEGNPVIGRIAQKPLKVPHTIKRMFDDAQRPMTKGELAAFEYANNRATTLALMSPVEMATHTYNVVNAITTMPGGLGSKVLAALGPPAKWAEAIAKIGNVNDASYVNDLMTLTEYAGTRRGGIAPLEEGAGPVSRGLERIGIPAGKAMAPIHRGLEKSRAPVFGTRGVENLSRVAFLRGLRAWAPELNDAQRAQIINNTMGTYAEKLQPGLVKGLKHIPLVGQPFAAAGVVMAKTAGKSLLGLGPKGFSPEVALMTGSSLALWYVINKAMDPQHRDPMRPGGPTFPSIRISQGKDRTVDVSLPMVTGLSGRGARVLGLTGLYEGIRDKRQPQDTALLVLRNLENTALQLGIGPAGTLLSEAATGYRPYVTRGGSFLKVADTSKENQLLENLKAGAKGAGVWRAIPEEGTLTPETVAGKTAAIFSQFAALPVTVKPGEDVQATAGIRGARGAIYETARDIAQKANNFSDLEQRHGYIESRIHRDLPEKDRALGRKAVMEIMKSIRKSQNRALGQLPSP